MKLFLHRLALVAGGFCGTVKAAEPVIAVTPLKTDFAQISSLVLSLLFILSLILVCAWLVKRVNGIAHAGSQQLKVLGALSVGSKERAVLVSAGDTQLLLGVASGSVALLHVFDEPVVNVEHAAAESPFATTLKQFSARGLTQTVAGSND